MSKPGVGSSGLGPVQTLGSTSRFRNLFGNVLNTKAYEGLNVSLTVGNNLLRTNGVYYAVPWSRSKGAISAYLAVFPVAVTGRVNQNPFCINTAAQQIVDFDIYPFAKGILATCGRDAIVKVWSHPTWDLIADLDVAECYLAGHEKKIDIVKFNPSVADLLMTCSSDLTVKLWDFRQMTEIQTIEGFDDLVMSAAWSYSGNMFMTATRDGYVRYYDPRHNSGPAGEVKTEHSPAKGINVTYLGDTEMLSTGFSKTGDREMYVWDARKFSEPLNVTSCGVKPGALTPFFDSTIGLLYVAAKGEGISVYEYTDTKSFTTVSEVKTERPQTSIAMLPKYQNDMDNCEVARFMKLSNENYIQTVSIRVPRKTKSTLFQEDLYPPTPSNQPGLTMENWNKGQKATPKLLDLKPANAVSVYDVPLEEGGIARSTKLVQQEEKKKGMSKGKEGHLFVLNKGYIWSSWEKKWTWTSGKRLYYGENKDSVSSSQSTSLNGLVRIVVIGASVDRAQLSFELDFGSQQISLKAENTQTRDDWVNEIAELTGAKVQSENPMIHSEGLEGAHKGLTATLLYQGDLQLYSEGFWGRGKWSDRYILLEEGVLSVFLDEKSFTSSAKEPLESIRLHQVISVRLTDVNASYDPSPDVLDTLPIFQINIPNRVLYLRAADAQAAMLWVMTIQEAAARAIKRTSTVLAQVEIHEIYERFSFSVEGYVMKKTGVSYEKMYLSVLGGDFYYFKSHFGLVPVDQFKGANVETISSVTLDSNKYCFKVVVAGKEHIHMAPNERVRGWWVRKLTKIQEAQFNLYEKMEIDALLANQATFDQMERYAETKMIDTGAIKNGTQPILIQITGKRNAYAELVPLTGKSLNRDCVFILDAGQNIYQWNGAQTSRICQARGADVANRIRKQERGGNANIISVNDTVGNQISPFLKLLGFKNSTELAACNEVAGEVSEGKGSRKSVIVLKITNSNDTRKKIQFVFNDDERLPSKELLLTEHAYVIDAETEIYVWIGSNSGQNERKLAMIIAKRLLCENDRVPWTTITKVLENTETVLFKEKFSDYPGELPVHVQPIEAPSNIAPKMEQPPISIVEMQKDRVLEEEIFDNGKGEITMWLVVQRIRQSGVKEWEKEVLGEEYHGHLFTGESYIFQYKYMHKNVEKFVIYFWQGRDSSISEKGASALESIDVANDTGGEARQVRIPQGHETQHFLSLFREALVIHLGKFRAAPKATQFYQVREKHKSLVAMEVDDPELCLNSDFMSFVISKKQVYFWYGKFCSEMERKYQGLTMFDEDQMAGCVKMEEGEETKDFLKVLAVDNQKINLEPAKKKSPPLRVFLVSGSSGIIVVEEILNCTQDDLDNEHVMIVDTFSQVFVWFGEKATSAEKELALDTAQRYVTESTKGHRPSTSLRVTYPFSEPRAFMKHFHGWTFTKLPAGKTKGAEKSLPLEMVLETFQTKSYTFELLTSDKVPEHLDRTKLETYLSDEDFEKIFGMPREQYDRLPEWKKMILRKEKRLY